MEIEDSLPQEMTDAQVWSFGALGEDTDMDADDEVDADDEEDLDGEELQEGDMGTPGEGGQGDGHGDGRSDDHDDQETLVLGEEAVEGQAEGMEDEEMEDEEEDDDSDAAGEDEDEGDGSSDADLGIGVAPSVTEGTSPWAMPADGFGGPDMQEAWQAFLKTWAGRASVPSPTATPSVSAARSLASLTPSPAAQPPLRRLEKLTAASFDAAGLKGNAGPRPTAAPRPSAAVGACAAVACGAAPPEPAGLPPGKVARPNATTHRAEYMRFLRGCKNKGRFPLELADRFSKKEDRSKLFVDWLNCGEDFGRVVVEHRKKTSASDPLICANALARPPWFWAGSAWLLLGNRTVWPSSRARARVCVRV